MKCGSNVTTDNDDDDSICTGCTNFNANGYDDQINNDNEMGIKHRQNDYDSNKIPKQSIRAENTKFFTFLV